MKLKIISDGTSFGTKLLNEDTGEPIGFVESIEWKINVGDTFATAVVKFVQVPVEIIAFDVDLSDEDDE